MSWADLWVDLYYPVLGAVMFAWLLAGAVKDIRDDRRRRRGRP